MILESKRLILREYIAEDWERVHIYGSCPDFTMFENWGPNTESDTKTFILEMITNSIKEPRYEFELAMIEKVTGLLIGGCGLRRDSRYSKVGNFGYAVNPEFQRKGFATEATRLLIEFGFKELNLEIIYATCDSRNTASYMVMEKCDLVKTNLFKNKRKFKGEENDELQYEIKREDYLD